MKDNRARKRLGPISTLFAVLMIATVGASPALAASTSAGVGETFTIAASVTVSNVPSTGTFASPPVCKTANVPFCQSADYSYAFTSTIGTNNGSGLTVAVKATTLVAGAATIPLSARCVLWGVPSGFTTTSGPDTGHCGQLDPVAPFTLGSTAAQGSVALAIEPLLRVDPNAYPAGAYAGTFTVVATTNP